MAIQVFIYFFYNALDYGPYFGVFFKYIIK